MKIYQEFHLSFPGTLLFFSLSREQRVHDGKILKGSFNNWIDSFLNPTAKDSQNLPFLGFIHRCSSHCVPSQVENDEARVHRELERGGGIRQGIRAHRPQWCSMGSGRRNHCMCWNSFLFPTCHHTFPDLNLKCCFACLLLSFCDVRTYCVLSHWDIRTLLVRSRLPVMNSVAEAVLARNGRRPLSVLLLDQRLLHQGRHKERKKHSLSGISGTT